MNHHLHMMFRRCCNRTCMSQYSRRSFRDKFGKYRDICTDRSPSKTLCWYRAQARTRIHKFRCWTLVGCPLFLEVCTCNSMIHCQNIRSWGRKVLSKSSLLYSKAVIHRICSHIRSCRLQRQNTYLSRSRLGNTRKNIGRLCSRILLGRPGVCSCTHPLLDRIVNRSSIRSLRSICKYQLLCPNTDLLGIQCSCERTHKCCGPSKRLTCSRVQIRNRIQNPHKCNHQFQSLCIHKFQKIQTR